MDFGVIVGGLSVFFDGLGIVNTTFTTAERLGKMSKSQPVQAKKIGARLKKASKKELTRSSSPEEREAAQEAVKAALETLDEARKDTEAFVQARRGRDAFLAYVNEHGGTQRREALDEDVRGLFDELLVIVADGVYDLAETDSGLVPQALTDLLNDTQILLRTLKAIETTAEKTLEAVNVGNAAADERYIETTGKLDNISGLINEHLAGRKADCERKVRFGSPPGRAAGFIDRDKQYDLYTAMGRPRPAETSGLREGPAFVDTDGAGRLADGSGSSTNGVGSSPGGGPVVVCGMRGVGKSQLAAAYYRECEQAGWPLVAWMDASTREALVAGLAELAVEMGIDDGKGDPDAAACRCVNRLNSGEGDRLIVFDNVEDFDDLTGLVPHGQGLRVLVTTTVASPGDSAGRLIAVGTFTRPQSVDFIVERTGLDDDAGAARLAEALGDLPVALAQAAATIKLNGYDTLDEYLAELGEYRLEEVVGRLPGDNYPALASAALRMAYTSALNRLATRQDEDDSDQDASTRQSVAFVQLAALALLAPSGVPRPWLHRVGKNMPIARQALGALISHSICTLSDDKRYVRIHGLQRRVLREDYKKEPDVFAVLKDAVVNLLKGIDMDKSDTDYVQRADALDMADQIRAIAEQQEGHVHYSPHEVCIDLSSVTVVVGETISCLTNMGRPQIALTLTEAVDILVAIPGRDDPSALATYNNLALAYMEAGDVSKAIDIFEALIPDLVGVLGRDHPDTLHTRGNLADAYREAESISKAIDMHETLLADRTRVLGRDHPDTLNTRNNLAGAHLDAGDLQQAIDMYEALQTDQTRVLGSDHPRTLTAQNNLALAYQKAGNLRKAIDMFEALIPDLVGVLRPDHPLTLTARNNLAAAYWEAGNTSKTINEYNALIPDLAYALGSDHPRTLAAQNNLAYVYYAADNLQIAVEMYENLIPDLINVFSANHPLTLAARSNLAAARKTQQASSPQADGKAESAPPPEN